MSRTKNEKKNTGDSEMNMQQKQNKNKSSIDNTNQTKRLKTTNNVLEKSIQFSNPDNGSEIVLTENSSLDSTQRKESKSIEQASLEHFTASVLNSTSLVLTNKSIFESSTEGKFIFIYIIDIVNC